MGRREDPYATQSPDLYLLPAAVDLRGGIRECAERYLERFGRDRHRQQRVGGGRRKDQRLGCRQEGGSKGVERRLGTLPLLADQSGKLPGDGRSYGLRNANLAGPTCGG